MKTILRKLTSRLRRRRAERQAHAGQLADLEFKPHFAPF